MSKKHDELPILAEAGTSGYDYSGGIIQEEWHPELRAGQDVKEYREMVDNEPAVHTPLMLIEMLMQQAEPEFVPQKKYSGDPEAHRWAEYMTGVLYDCESTWREIMSNISTVMVYGWSSLYPTYKLRKGESDNPMLSSQFDDGLWGIRDLEPRAQDTLLNWEFDDLGRPTGWVQQAPPHYKRAFLSIDRLVHFRVQPVKNNPQGKSMLRHIWRPWRFKRTLEETEGIGAERDLAGVPVIRVPRNIMSPSASTAERAIRELMEGYARKMKQNQMAGVVFPASEDSHGKTGFEIGLMGSGGSGKFDVGAAIERKRSEIMMGLLAQFLLLGQQGVGSFALSDDQSNIFEVAIRAMLAMIADVIDRDLTPRLMTLNGVPRKYWPEMGFGDIAKQDVVKIMTAIQMAATSGIIVPTEDDESKVRDILGLSPRNPADAVLDIGQNDMPGQAQVEPMGPITEDIGAGQDDLMAQGVDSVQDAVMNSAQVSSLIDVVSAYNRSELSYQQAVGVLTVGFRQTQSQAAMLLGPREVADAFPQQGAGAGDIDVSSPMSQEDVAQKAEDPKPELGEADLVTVDEAIEALGGRVPRGSVIRAIRNGKLPGVKIGNTYYVETGDLRRSLTGGYGSII